MDTKLEAFSSVWDRDPLLAIENVFACRDIPVASSKVSGVLFVTLYDRTMVCVQLIRRQNCTVLSFTPVGCAWKETRPADTADQGFEAACWLAEVAEQ